MAACSICKNTIIAGGIKTDGFRFCSKACQENGRHLIVAGQIPKRFIDAYANMIHAGTCGVCGEDKIIDLHESHKVWSMIYFFNAESEQHISCSSCARKKQIKAVFYSFFMGLWGFGIFLVPIQVSRNIWDAIVGPDPAHPSEKLKTAIRMRLAKGN